MVIDNSKQNLFYINTNWSFATRSTVFSDEEIKNMFKVVNFNCEFTFENLNYNYYTRNAYYSYGHADDPSKACGIYLGDQTSFNKTINSKINQNNISTFKKVYFDPSCKYPRFKLSEKTNIKRCLNPQKADSIIISKREFKKYVYYGVFRGDRDSYVYYSKSQNQYFFLDYYVNNVIDKSRIKFEQIVKSHIGHNMKNITDFADFLIQIKIIPADSNLFYKGPVYLLDEKNVTYFNNIINNYMLLTYYTELDKFVNINLQKPNSEDLETLHHMLSSTDDSVIGMGLKLLSNYDITSSACSIGTLLIQNRDNIKRNSTITSVGFEQILKTLNITAYELKYGSPDEMTNRLYKVSTNEEDKEKTKVVIINKVKDLLLASANSYKELFSNFNLNIEIKIS